MHICFFFVCPKPLTQQIFFCIELFLQMSEATAFKSQTWSTSPCAGCKIQRKKCSEKCVLAPYFPQNNPEKFLLVHRIFGNGHVIKLLQDLPAEQRGDAVSTMVYEASERIRDPVHGCVGIINELQNKVAELQSQLASAQAEISNITMQHVNLLPLVTEYHEVSDPNFFCLSPQESEDMTHTSSSVLDDLDPLELWEPLWT